MLSFLEEHTKTVHTNLSSKSNKLFYPTQCLTAHSIMQIAFPKCYFNLDYILHAKHWFKTKLAVTQDVFRLLMS